MKPIIKVENLGKRYSIGPARAGQKTLREAFSDSFRNLGHLRRGERNREFKWALRGVSFEVAPSTVLGVIGRNGAGKSTLLKVLSRITEPTTGVIDIEGRVGTLLEVGTGFHPELTGRENVFLSGIILGMSRRVIARKFDEIVAFAEVSPYIDTPVKRYSSGMQLRLAFAVAAHLEPEILLIDEVLSVGDAAFQKKCLGQIGGSSGNRTTLFVSHDLAAVRQLCEKAILISDGEISMYGEAERVVEAYLAEISNGQTSWDLNVENMTDDTPVKVSGVYLLNLDGTPLRVVSAGTGLILRIQYDIALGVVVPSGSFVVRLKTHMGTEILRLSNSPISGFPILNLKGKGYVDLTLPVLPLTAGNYFVDVAFGRRGQGYYLDLKNLLFLTIVGSDVYNSGFTLDHSRCIMTIAHKWTLNPEHGKSVDSGWIGKRLLNFPDEEFCEQN